MAKERQSEIIATLYPLGIPAHWIASKLKLSLATAAKDLRRMRIKRTPDHPRARGDIFRAAFTTYARMRCGRNEGLAALEGLEGLLTDFLDIESITNTFAGFNQMLETMRMPAYPPGCAGYINLLAAIYGEKDRSVDAAYAWSRYLHGVAWEAQQAPTSMQEALEGFVRSLATHCRDQVGPTWPGNGAEQIEAVLREKLSAREISIVKMRFHIGDLAIRMPDQAVEHILGVSSRQHRYQIAKYAIAKLRATAYRRLEHLWNTKPMLHVALTRRMLPPDTDPLTLYIEDLEDWLCVRTRKALSAAGITTIGDLVQWQRFELLKLHNFGRKCLNEVINMLASFDLCLGMRPAE